VSKKRVEGVSGVLGSLITPQSAVPPDEEPDKDRGTRHNVEEQADGFPDQSPRRIHARRGRPPGQKRQPPRKREKVTLRIDAALIARYREWSWEERRQLGELVEAAMRCFMEKADLKTEGPSS
jgi:hypothetical protein